MILTLVGLAMREKVDLVAPDYYAQELKYQERIDEVNRSRRLPVPLKWTVEENGIIFRFPQEVLRAWPGGRVILFRASDPGKDRIMEIHGDAEGCARISFDGIAPGAYTMQIHWRAGKSTYYNEGFIMIP